MNLTYPLWLPLSNAKTYIVATLFIAGNILFPMLFHAVPNGGHIFLPIFFFTLIGAFHYGLYVGLFTALCSPLLSHILVGMPAMHILPIIIAKSLILAVCASIAARYFQKITVPIIALVVVVSQIFGFFAEWAIAQNITLAFNDLRMGVPGMLLQILGGYFLIRFLNRE
ncbi:MAG: ECF transporter S component [Bacteroidetes bacterium]|nr:ECF transporter S component [Bacteroidota bacterium]